MADAARQLQGIYLAGFDIEHFELFPKCVGVRKGGCLALLEAAPDGLRMVGQPGWYVAGGLGVLVEREGRKCFQNKAELVEATAERLAALAEFTAELETLLAPTA